MLLEGMHIARGQSFLACGSGSGYLCALVALLVGPTGTIRGIDIQPENVASARTYYQRWRTTAAAGDSNAERTPEAEFITGNCFQLDPTARQYDRVYVGAGCTPARKPFFRAFLAPGGVLVIPTENAFLRIVRTADGFTEDVLSQVSFAPLLDPPASGDAPRFSESTARLSTVFVSGKWEGFLSIAGKRQPLELTVVFGASGTIGGSGTLAGAPATITGNYTAAAPFSVNAILSSKEGAKFELAGFRERSLGGIFGSWTTVTVAPSAATKATGAFAIGPSKETAPITISVRFLSQGQIVHIDSISPAETARGVILAACEKAGIRADPKMALIHNGAQLASTATMLSAGVSAGTSLIIAPK
jgi:protein-L-isoaspartate(D-aspartate) O-methyltransferase